MPLLVAAGADVLVAGSAVFRGGSPDRPRAYADNIRAIRAAAEDGGSTLGRLFNATLASHVSQLWSIPTDCPQRDERRGWTGDAALTAAVLLMEELECAELFRELDDLSNKWGQGDLRATTRQAFQLHGVLKGNLKTVIAAIANVGSNTYGGCGDISRNVMVPPVHFPNNPAYGYAQQYAKALADLFKPMTESFKELWLDGKPAAKDEYWQDEIKEFNLDEVRAFDNGRGIITGHPIEPLYGRTYLPKKFKIAVTVPGDNSVDLYINDIGAVVIMEADGVTLKGFNIVVGGGMGRTHKAEKTFARAASHLGFVEKDDFFECMKAILAVQVLSLIHI